MQDKSKILTPDFCVIGAGSGGLSFAAGAVQMGASVVIVEKDKMGGDCLNYGCVPSKALLSLAKKRYQASPQTTLDYTQIHDAIHDVIAQIAPNDSVKRFESLGAKVILGPSKFKSPDSLVAKNTLIKAKRFIIATGSKAAIPPIQGLDSIPYLTNETIFELKVCPKHLLIIGGGPIGMEMAQGFRRFGAQVTILESFKIMPRDDAEFVIQLKSCLLKEGVKIEEGVKISHVESWHEGGSVHFVDDQGKAQKIQASHILVAAGRQATLNELQLEAANVAYTPKGIIVNKYLRTSNSRIFAIGDCIGGYQFTHVANYQAGIALRNTIFRLFSPVQTKAIPWVTYTDPELAHVGFSQDQLATTNTTYQILEVPFSEIDRAQAEHRTDGGIKVFVTPKGKILGVTILGLNAGELILPWVLAINEGLNIKAMAQVIAPYPTFSEISKKVAGSFYKEKLFGQRTQKIVRLLMRITP